MRSHRLFHDVISTSANYVIVYFYLPRQLTSYLFYNTTSSSAESAYVIPILQYYVVMSNAIKGNTELISPIHQQEQHQRQVDYLTSHNMDELKNLELIEQLCRNLRRQQQSATATG